MIMGKFQAMNKYFTIFLALVACHDSLLVHCREIKSLAQQHSSLNKGIVVPEDNIPKPLKSSVNNVDHVAITPSLAKKDDSTVTPKYGVASTSVEYSDSSPYTNAFRPTTPGSSPGVGHRKFAQQDKDMKAKVYVTEGEENGFKPTNPGHSPGVGHSQQNNIGNN